MTDKEKLNKKVSDNLAISFHEQFAKNQNHHQMLFLQILGILLTVLVGFGYLYIRVGTKLETIITHETMYMFVAFASFLLSLGIALIVDMALGFRRDQLVSCNIRVMADAMSISNNSGYFPKGFNPVNKKDCFSWMPGFNQIFFVALFIIKIFMFCSLFVLDVNYVSFSSILISILSFIITVSSFVVDILFLYHYHKKWKKYCDDAPSRLQR